MIERIFSRTLSTFKELKFHDGLNILVVDKTPTSTGKQTRNRAGKTSLIELVHFLLGGDCDKDSLFRSKELENHFFGITFDLKDSKTTVERTGLEPSEIIILEGETDDWPIKPSFKKRAEKKIISNTNWNAVLGEKIFGLKEDKGKYSPTFRSLFSYFVRRENSGGFIYPTQQNSLQQRWDQQVDISFFLDLNWFISQQWQFVRDRENSIAELKKIVKSGNLEFIENTASLRTKLAVSEHRTSMLKNSINNFKLLPEYHELEREASNITIKVGELSNENVIDYEIIDELSQAITSETPPSFDNVEFVYNKAGKILPELVKNRFEDLKVFHETIIENRKAYLSNEIENAKLRIENREKGMGQLSERKEQIMKILKSHGALDQFIKIQSELSKAEAETESLRQKFKAAEEIESKKNELEMERRKLQQRLLLNYQERKKAIDNAILTFENISKSLYEEAGSFIVESSLNGPAFKFQIQGEKSKGIKNMQIFCLDMMLMKLCMEMKIGPKFIVHDSHIFDGVDGRQVGKALQIGAEMAGRLGFQYIVTMNSDSLPKEVPQGFDLNKFILPTRLTDATENGGLFGIRF
jgi:uncharacterized protein YydD (DUF2326 family)